jgi:hypothetical protein
MDLGADCAHDVPRELTAMAHAHLHPCPGCARHVRVTDVVCPFCAATFDDSFHAVPELQAPRGRLTRAALFALGTGTLSVAAACSSSSQPAYGGPVVLVDGAAPVEEDAGSTPDAGPGDAGAAFDATGVQPVYGAPAMELDATDDRVLYVVPYGIPPH